MIKNEANKIAKKPVTDTKTLTTTAAAAAPVSNRAQSTEVDNRRVAPVVKRNETESDECDTVKPMSKIDLIKKFDSKYHQSTEDAVDNKQVLRQTMDSNQKYNTSVEDTLDEVENDENLQNSNSEEFDYKSRTNEYETAANNNYKNGNSEAIIPPKPLPRTSRNNSVSSLSSESGSLSAVNANVLDDANRPVAKPRTTTTSYKVLQNKQTPFSFFFLLKLTNTHNTTRRHVC